MPRDGRQLVDAVIAVPYPHYSRTNVMPLPRGVMPVPGCTTLTLRPRSRCVAAGLLITPFSTFPYTPFPTLPTYTPRPLPCLYTATTPHAYRQPATPCACLLTVILRQLNNALYDGRLTRTCFCV